MLGVISPSVRIGAFDGESCLTVALLLLFFIMIHFLQGGELSDNDDGDVFAETEAVGGEDNSDDNGEDDNSGDAVCSSGEDGNGTATLLALLELRV